MYCYVRDCPNGLKSLKKKKDSDLIKFFSAPEDKILLEKWRRVIPEGENVLSSKDKVCDAHFLPSEVLWFTETKLPNGNVRRLLRDEPILRPGTIPSIFPAEKVGKENATLPEKERQETPKPIAKSVPSALMKDKSATPRSIVKNTNTVVTEKIETPKSNFRIRFKDPVESSSKRNPQRVKRRSTILDDYWTDDELNQVHNPGGSKAAGGSAKKRKTESGLQPVIRLVPLECLMDKTVSKNKTPKTVVVNRPSTEEIDQELKKVIEIPLLTRLKPNKSMTIRSTKETVQFKPPKKTLSKSKIKIMPHSETLVSHDLVTASPSDADGFNEVKTETPDIEEELARMEMDEESEDVKSVDIVVMNPPLGEDDSVVVKSEEEDDGYTVNEMTGNPIVNIPEGDEIPTIKSESEEEQPAPEVDSNDTCDEILSLPSSVPEIVAVEGSEQQGSALPSENNDSIPTMLEQPNEVPEVQAAVDQNKDVEEPKANEAEPVEKSSAMETEEADTTVCNKGTEKGEKDKITEDKTHEEGVLEDKEKENNSESRKEAEAEIPTESVREEVNADSQGMGPEKDVESAVETEPSQEIVPEKPENESAMEIEKEALPPQNIEETTKPNENEEIPKPVENEISQVVEEEIKEAADDGKDSGPTVVLVEPMAETVNETEPPGGELEKNLNDKEILNEDESRSDIINLPEAGDDLPEVGDETGAGITNETDKAESVTIINTDEESAKPGDDVIDVSDSEEVEPNKGSTTSEAGAEADTVIDVDLSDGADQSPSSGDVAVEQSSASQEVEPERTNDECAMETEDGDEPSNVQRTEDIEDDDVHSDASPIPDEEVTENEKDNETKGKKRESKQAERSEIDEMDIEAEVARLVSEVEESAKGSSNKEVENEGKGGSASNASQEKEKPDKETAAKEAGQPQEIVLQDTTNLGGITAAGVQNLFSPETIQEILKQIKLPLTTPVTFRITPPANTPSSSSSSGRGRGRRKGMRGTNRQVGTRASSSSDASHNSIDLFRHLTRTRTVFDFPTFVTDIDDEMQYWKLCQILKESFHELIETRNTKTSIGKLTLRVAINRPKKPKVQQNNGEPEADTQ